MDTSEYNKIKQDILNLPVIYREVEPKEIVALGGNFYNIVNTEVYVDPGVAGKIDSYLGIKNNQTRMAYDSYGEKGLTNLRNFFGQAKNEKDSKLVLVANTHSKQIVSAVPIKQSVILPHAFFDFAEMFMDKNEYLPEKMEYNMGPVDSISLIMRPVKEKFMEFAKGDEFLFNGLYFRWTPGEIALGNYYIRLVCSNGQTQTSQNAISKIAAPTIENFHKLLELNADSDPIKRNVEKMLESAKQSMNTKASVRELGAAVNILKQQHVNDEDANQIIPYLETKNLYKDAGYEVDTEHMALAKSNKTVWELYNMLTYFATHNKVWSPQDIKRTNLMESSMNFLLRKRDIVEHYDIF